MNTGREKHIRRSLFIRLQVSNLHTETMRDRYIDRGINVNGWTENERERERERRYLINRQRAIEENKRREEENNSREERKKRSKVLVRDADIDRIPSRDSPSERIHMRACAVDLSQTLKND